ncbi:hypothetical protein EV646_11224 [Kribbella antiqua]|uniref:PKD domain-containing protein n=1 Tax=Kribbella antiqua TaxID=2512217 RepID=A0A4R2II33_9ACTN|nr:PKD domain-containing protein [Kribbella antiqua]TCO43448.1 hypothetical protein EV646_11224 [Kribbella antiqua]
MKRSILTVGILAALSLTASITPASGLTSTDVVSPQSAATPKPKSTPRPTVDGKRTKDGVTLDGKAKVDDRLSEGWPPKKSKPTVPASADAGGPTKDTATPPAPPERIDAKLNLGICGRPGADGTIPGPTRCQPVGPEEPVVPTPGVPVNLPQPEDVSWEQVLAEARNVAFPGLGVKVQPVGRTLVNLETIVYTDQSRVTTAQVTLLGFPVEVEATPMSYLWRFGDGASLSTTTPGKPYPAKEITHKYLKKGSVGLTLTTNYAARFRVAGGAWQYVEGTVPITGPATPLQVREAVPVLVDPER